MITRTIKFELSQNEDETKPNEIDSRAVVCKKTEDEMRTNYSLKTGDRTRTKFKVVLETPGLSHFLSLL